MTAQVGTDEFEFIAFAILSFFACGLFLAMIFTFYSQSI
jgi:hypothetical protein